MDNRNPSAEPITMLKAQRYMLWAIGLLVLLWGCLHPWFRDAEDLLTGLFVVPLAMGVAMLILGCVWTGKLKGAGLWLALALVGQAVSLQMIDAGPYLRYQHYRPFERLLSETHLLLLSYLGVQAILVIAGLISRWPTIRNWAKHNLRWWQLVGLGLVFFFTSATVSRQVDRYAAELLLATFIQAIHLGNIVLVVWAMPSLVLSRMSLGLNKLLRTAEEEGDDGTPRVDRFVVLVAVWVFAATTCLNLFVYERHPHIQDEVVYLLQARYFADGALTMPVPSVPEAFEIYLMQMSDNVWYPTTPPGWPAVLALGVLVGVPWLVNPLLAGLNILLLYLLVQRIYGNRMARLSVVLVGCSPWYLFVGMSFMTHMLTITCILGALLLTARAREGHFLWAALAGGCIGAASLIRPLDGMVTACFVGLWAVGVGGRRLRFTGIIALVLGAIALGSLHLVYNQQLTGQPTTFPIMVYTDEHFGPKTNAFGFGPERGLGWPIDPYPGHGPIDGLINANLNMFCLNTELFGWGAGSLVFLSLAVVCRGIRRRDGLMYLMIGSVFVAYFFYYFSGGPDFGARYWFPMLIPCAVLTALGIQVLQQKLVESTLLPPHTIARAYSVFLSLTLVALVCYLPWRCIDKYHRYLMMRPDIPQLAREFEFANSLVLIRGDEHPDYVSAAAYNPLDLRSDQAIYAWDRSPEVRTRLLDAYPDRTIWVVDGPTRTNGPYRVIGNLEHRAQVQELQALQQ